MSATVRSVGAALPARGRKDARGAALNDLALMRLHADVLFTHDAAGCIVATNEPDGDRAPRLFLGRTRDGVVWRVRDDVPAEMAADLERICRDEPPLDDHG